MNKLRAFGYVFDASKACVVCQHVMEGVGVALIAHNKNGDLQFLCRQEAHSKEEARVVCLSHVIDQHKALAHPPLIAMGSAAVVDDAGHWKVYPNAVD